MLRRREPRYPAQRGYSAVDLQGSLMGEGWALGALPVHPRQLGRVNVVQRRISVDLVLSRIDVRGT